MFFSYDTQTILSSVVCLMTGTQLLPKRVLRKVRSSASAFNFQYSLVFLRLSSSCFRLLPRLSFLLSSEFRRNRSTTDHIFCIHQILEKKWEHNEAVHKLFIDFKKTYDSVRREVLYNILMEFRIPMKLVRLIKMCLAEQQSPGRQEFV